MAASSNALRKLSAADLEIATIERIECEKRIAKAAIDCLLSLGYAITVSDGEEEVLERSKDPEAILGAMMTTDEDWLYVHRSVNEQRPFGWVRFVYGNEGWDVICDYTVNLELALAPVQIIIDAEEDCLL